MEIFPCRVESLVDLHDSINALIVHLLSPARPTRWNYTTGQLHTGSTARRFQDDFGPGSFMISGSAPLPGALEWRLENGTTLIDPGGTRFAVKDFAPPCLLDHLASAHYKQDWFDGLDPRLAGLLVGALRGLDGAPPDRYSKLLSKFAASCAPFLRPLNRRKRWSVQRALRETDLKSSQIVSLGALRPNRRWAPEKMVYEAKWLEKAHYDRDIAQTAWKGFCVLVEQAGDITSWEEKLFSPAGSAHTQLQAKSLIQTLGDTLVAAAPEHFSWPKPSS